MKLISKMTAAAAENSRGPETEIANAECFWRVTYTMSLPGGSKRGVDDEANDPQTERKTKRTKRAQQKTPTTGVPSSPLSFLLSARP